MIPDRSSSRCLLLDIRRPLEPLTARGAYKYIKEAPSCMVLYAMSTSAAEPNYADLDTSPSPSLVFAFVSSAVNGAGLGLVSFPSWFGCFVIFLVSVVYLFTNPPAVSCFHRNQLLN